MFQTSKPILGAKNLRAKTLGAEAPHPDVDLPHVIGVWKDCEEGEEVIVRVLLEQMISQVDGTVNIGTA